MLIVSEHYARQVATISADSTVREAADAMKVRAVGSLVVMRDESPAGIVTDRDLLERVIAEGRDAGKTAVADVMSAPLESAAPGDSLERVIEVMSKHGIRRVPLVGDGKLCGIVALDDVVARLTEELHDLAEATRQEIDAAQRAARAREIARDVASRLQELGNQLEHLGSEAKHGVLREIEALRERIRTRKG